MTNSRIGTVAICLLLGGCGFLEIFDTHDSDRRRVQADVRDILEELQASQAQANRKDIATLVKQEVAKQAAPDERIAGLERQVRDLDSQLRAMDQRPGTDNSAILADELDRMSEQTASLDDAISDLRDQITVQAGTTSARFERLELRTSKVAWPEVSSQRALHLASYRRHENALRGWEILSQRHGHVLAGLQPTLIEVDTVAGRYIRLMVGEGFSQSELQRLRTQIREAGGYAAILPLNDTGAGSAPGS